MGRVTSTNANRMFSEILAKVREGQTIEITVRGEIVAKLVPVSKAEAERDKAWQQHLERLRSQPVLNLPRVTREELYDE
jgi:prevent-host-death family protein